MGTPSLRPLFGPHSDRLIRSPPTTVIFLSSVMMMMNATLLSPVLPVLMQEFSVSESRIGLVMTALTLPPVVAIPVMGYLADRFKRRYVLSGSLLLVGLAGLGIPLTTTFRQLLALRVFQGIGYSGVMPVTVTLLGDLYEGDAETTAQGMRTFFNNAGASLFPVVAGVLLVISWRAPFYLFLVHVPAAVFAIHFIPNIQAHSEPDQRYGRQLLSLLKESNVIVLLLVGFLLFFIHDGFLTYAPIVLIRGYEVGVGTTGLYIGVMLACAAIGASQAGRFTNHFSQRSVMIGGLGCSGGSLVVIAFAGSLPALVAGGLIVVYGFTWGLIAPIQKSMLNQIVMSRIRGGIISASYVFTNLGKAMGPVVAGVVIAFSDFRFGFALLGASTAVVVPLIFVYLETTKS